MDIQMPKMNGIETVRKVSEEWDEGSRPYIIAFTANTIQEAQDQYKAAGMSGYVVKPIDFYQLEAALRKVPAKLNPD
jgi:CheY-like chemotaxis protein